MKNPGEGWRLQGHPTPSSFICSRWNARCRLLIGPPRMPEGDGSVHVGRDALALPGPVSPAVPAPTPGWRNKWRPRRSTAAPPPRSAPRSHLVGHSPRMCLGCHDERTLLGVSRVEDGGYERWRHPHHRPCRSTAPGYFRPRRAKNAPLPRANAPVEKQSA